MDRSIKADLLNLSIFKCKFCSRRLQRPVLQVEAFGNICGNCYGRSVYTNVTENTDVEAILSRNCVPCNFADRGCTFKEDYRITCKHEEKCYFRDRVCPFNYQDECESILRMNIIDHIERKHGDYVLDIVDNSVSVKNPLPPNYCCVFYLLKDNDKRFLLRIKYNNDEEEVFLYTLYYFNSGQRGDDIEFLISIKNKNVKLETERVLPVHESNISRFDESDCITIKFSILKSIESFETVQILVTKKENAAISNSTLECSPTNWFKCSVCDEYAFHGVHICSTCGARRCHNCYKDDQYCSLCGHNVSKIKQDFLNLASAFKFPCKNDSCKELISAEDYKLHKSKCHFTPYECVYVKTNLACNWTGLHADLIRHIEKDHGVTDKNRWIINYKVGRFENSIIKNKTVFKYNFGFRKDHSFFIKIGTFVPLHVDNCYLWTLYIANKPSQKEFLITNTCVNFDEAAEEVVNIEKYLVDNKLDVTISIKCTDNITNC